LRIIHIAPFYAPVIDYVEGITNVLELHDVRKSINRLMNAIGHYT